MSQNQIKKLKKAINNYDVELHPDLTTQLKVIKNPHGFTIQIPGKPISWKRVGGLIHRYDTQKTEKLFVGLLLRGAMGNLPPYTGPIKLVVAFYFQAPKKYKFNQCTDFYNTTHIDIDNCLKFLMDCCTNAHVFNDDCQVVAVDMSKRYTLQHAPAYTHLTITQLI